MPVKRTNKPGAGRPRVGRTANLPRIRREHYAIIKSMAEHWQIGVAATIERILEEIGPI